MIQMVQIPAGEIVLRDDRFKKSWHVEIDSFRLAQHPVTQQEYEAITHKSPSSFKGNLNPVENVSWYDAIHFCNLLSLQDGLPEVYSENSDGSIIISGSDAKGYRLPSEAEWQYACQAGNVTARYGDIDKIAWYKANSGGTTHEVGQKHPNAWGLYDMLGNVWEWCHDIYNKDIYDTYRIFRGGGWNDPERGCMATNRRRSHPAFYIDDLGFRVAISG